MNRGLNRDNVTWALQKLPINFTKFNENRMEAKSQQNFYNKAAIVVISSKLSSLEHTLSGSGAKSHKMAHHNPLFPVYVVYSLQTVE